MQKIMSRPYEQHSPSPPNPPKPPFPPTNVNSLEDINLN